MNLKLIFYYFGKFLLCGIAFFIGIAVNGIVLSMLGLDHPV